MRLRVFVLAGAALLVAPAPAPAQDEPVVVYLVRHAERADDGTSDPPISPAGWDRARLLATMLRDAGLTQIHTTDYLRTRSTGEPVAQVTGLGLAEYDARALDSFAEQIRDTDGRHLVIGHSDTTPALVRALGGQPGDPIVDAEYDRLYVVTIVAGTVTTVLLRYGAPYQG